MNTHFRRADAGDAASIARLGHETFTETFGYLFSDHADDLRGYLDATFGPAKIEASLEKPGNAYWIAEHDDAPVGYAKLKLASPLPVDPTRPACQLQKIYVLAGHIGCGIGRALLTRVVAHAAAHAPTLWLDVLKANERASGFYAKAGFVTAGEDTYTIGAQRFLFHLMARRFA